MPKGSLLVLLLFILFNLCDCQKDTSASPDCRAKEEIAEEDNGTGSKGNMHGRVPFKRIFKAKMEGGAGEGGEEEARKAVRRWPGQDEERHRRNGSPSRSAHGEAEGGGASSEGVARRHEYAARADGGGGDRPAEPQTSPAPAAVETRPLKVWLRGVHSILTSYHESTTRLLNLQNSRLGSSSAGNYPDIMDVTRRPTDATVESVARSRTPSSREFPASPPPMSDEIKSFVKFLMSSSKSQHDETEDSSTRWRSALSGGATSERSRNDDDLRSSAKSGRRGSSDGIAWQTMSGRKKANSTNTKSLTGPDSDELYLVKSAAKAKKTAKKAFGRIRSFQSTDLYDEHIMANFATDLQTERTNSRSLRYRSTPRMSQSDRAHEAATAGSPRRLSPDKSLNVQDYDFEIEEYDDLGMTSVRSAERKGTTDVAATSPRAARDEEMEETEEEEGLESKKKAKSKEEGEETSAAPQSRQVNLKAATASSGRAKASRSRSQARKGEEAKEKMNVHRPVKGRPPAEDREKVAEAEESGEGMKGRALNHTEVIQRLLMPGCCYVVVSKGACGSAHQRQRQRVSVLVPRAKCPATTTPCPPPPVKLSLCLGLCLGTVAVPQGEAEMSSLIDLIKGQMSTPPTCKRSPDA